MALRSCVCGRTLARPVSVTTAFGTKQHGGEAHPWEDHSLGHAEPRPGRRMGARPSGAPNAVWAVRAGHAGQASWQREG